VKIRRGDTVVVIKGDDKGKTGKVLSVDTKKKVVFVQRVRLVKRHEKRKPGGGAGGAMEGGITEKEAPIPIANVALIDPKSNKPTRIRMQCSEGIEDRHEKRRAKVRLAVRSDVEIERPTE
jgi:large subunit ribosomal protein L24